MKNFMKTIMLIGLFLVFTSSSTSSEVIAAENVISLSEECSPLASPSLSEFIGPPEKEMNNEDPFCFYYFLLWEMYYEACNDTGGYSDCLQAAYYFAKIIECGVIFE